MAELSTAFDEAKDPARKPEKLQAVQEDDKRLGSFARSIAPEQGIAGFDLSAAFDKGKDPAREPAKLQAVPETDQRLGSFARSIAPEGGIKGPNLKAQKVREPSVRLPSAQVANTNLSPREPAPSFGYDRAKAGEHRQAMQVDAMAVKRAALKAKAQLFAREDDARKARGAPSLDRSFGKERGRERGD